MTDELNRSEHQGLEALSEEELEGATGGFGKPALTDSLANAENRRRVKCLGCGGYFYFVPTSLRPVPTTCPTCGSNHVAMLAR